MWRSFAVAVVAGLLSACSGGDDPVITTGPGDTPPLIFASVTSFPVGNTPTGYVPDGFNTLAEVEVADGTSGAPVAGASVSVNGVALTYDAAKQNYTGNLLLAPGASVTVGVVLGSSSYTASGAQFSAYPSVSSPLAGATWSPSDANYVAWSGGTPTAGVVYVLGVADSADVNGTLVWPSGGDSLQIVPLSTTSYTIGAGNLTYGDRLVIVGIATAVYFATAAPGSGMVIAGMNYVPVTVADIPPPPATLLSITITPGATTVVKGRTRALVATGSYSDGSNRDVTAQVSWTSSDPAKVDVGATGAATAIDGGSATVTAALGAISGTAVVNVFVPDPSPIPPLSQSVAYQIDYAHSGRAAFGTPLVFPTNATWSVELNGAASYPLIAEGKVFVTTASGGSPYGTSLYALDLQTGAIAWGPVAISGTYFWSGHAYDHGRIFVVNFDGLLRSFDAATGAAGWSTQLPEYWVDAPPTAVNGIVYVGGAGSHQLYAVDQTNGSLLWSVYVYGGHHSSPAVSEDGVFVSYGYQTRKVDPLSGETMWYSGANTYDGKTAAYANGRVYARDPSVIPPGKVLDAATGAEVGTFTAGPIPAFSAQSGFFVNANTLQAIDFSSNNVLWSFTGDGGLVTAPIVIDDAVIVGSSTGNVYALDAASGAQLWSGNAGAAIHAPDERNVSQPLTGFGAGEGYLVVPAGNRVTAWRVTGP